jgi:cephalosporin hydroxylase
MIRIDGDRVIVSDEDGERELAIGSPEAFRLISDLWLRAGWDSKYVYTFSWLGRPIIQLPEDMFRLQEVIFRVRPDVIVETGVAHGGGLIFYASLCSALGAGRVIGIDIEIRPHNREAIEAHPLFDRIALIEGSSTDPAVVDEVRSQIGPGETVMVLLDSCHTKAHVRDELEAYAPLVTCGSYIIAMDGIMQQVAGAPRTSPDWTWNNPRQAAREFVAEHDDFVIEAAPFAFDEGMIPGPVTYWPEGYIKRVR